MYKKIISRMNVYGFAVFMCLILPYSVTAGSFDGSANLLCAPQTVIECGPGGECAQATPASVNLPNFFQIDFARKMISAIPVTENSRKSRIKNIEQLAGKLILQGAGNETKKNKEGLGWSMAISEDTGSIVMSAAGDQEAFVIFGACTQLP